MAVSRINEAGLNVNQYGNRNIVINGAMKVAQRSTSETGLGTADGYFTLDRFLMNVGATSAGRFTMSQSTVTDLPGFSNALKLACTTADTSIAAGEQLTIDYRIEGQDLQQFKKGTSEAESFTVSFYAKANANATYACELYDTDNTRQITKLFNVTSSWTRITLTFPADTTGAFADDNALSLNLIIAVHGGSDYTSGTLNSTAWASVVTANRRGGITSFFDSTSRTLEITGLQLEVGDTATDFEHRTFGDELQRCQRYFCRTYTYGTATGTATANGCVSGPVFAAITYSSPGTFRFPVEMRSAPTVQVYSTQNADTTGKVTADAADGTAGTAFTGTASTFIYRNNDSTGVVANAFLKAQATADAEL